MLRLVVERIERCRDVLGVAQVAVLWRSGRALRAVRAWPHPPRRQSLRGYPYPLPATRHSGRRPRGSWTRTRRLARSAPCPGQVTSNRWDGRMASRLRSTTSPATAARVTHLELAFSASMVIVGPSRQLQVSTSPPSERFAITTRTNSSTAPPCSATFLRTGSRRRILRGASRATGPMSGAVPGRSRSNESLAVGC